jgi:hypothetical protein
MIWGTIHFHIRVRDYGTTHGSAHHFVFAQTEDAEIQKLAHELIGSRIFGRTAFAPRGPLPTAKDYLIKFLGLKVES